MRLVGHCEGCPASEATLELAIKKALEETAPDLEGLEVEGVRERQAPPGAFELPVIQSERQRRQPAAGGLAGHGGRSSGGGARRRR